MSLLARIAFVTIVSLVLAPASTYAQTAAPVTTDTSAKKTDSTAQAESAVDKSMLTGFYEIMQGRGLTISLEKDELYGQPTNGEKRKLIYQSGLAFLVDGTKMTLTFIPGPDGRATDLVMQQNGQTRMVHRTQ